MATTSTFSLAAKLRLLIGMKRISAHMEGLDPNFLHRSAHLDDPHRSSENYGLRYFGAEVRDHMIDPLVRLVGATGAELTSALDIISGLSMAGQGSNTFRGGQDRVVQALAEQLDIKYEATVVAVEELTDSVSVKYKDETGATLALGSRRWSNIGIGCCRPRQIKSG